MSTTQATPTITDTRFNKLKAKLRELFELDKSDLDFGIYRIMAAKNKEVTDFLDRQLKDVVKQTLTEHGAGATDALQAELDEMIAGLRKAKLSDEQIEASDGVKDLREKLAAAGGKTGEELEADIYNHLLAFFSRYYDEGDFISQRRYKGDTYAIPYSGEEVTLHWANKDQYYIKSGEWHKDYRFKLPDGRRVRFALVDATQETGNNKEPDEAKRRYILVDDSPVVAEGDTLTFRMHFKAPSEAEKERAADGAVAIFGGDYAKDKSPKKGDERTQFCADAEQRAIEHIPAEWTDAVTAAAATPDKPDRTLLGKHLDAFTARNTFDYFIHKDLGGFLRRELDFYIKNEVVRLDDLDAAPAAHLQRVQGRVRAIRRVASKVIELLEALENFQKKLWLKKKFVLNTSWLVTVDRVPERLRDTVAENAEQWAEWERLGFKPEGDTGRLFGGAEWGTRAYLDACDKLVVDTRLFDEAFTAELLASEEVLAGAATLHAATDGVLIQSENYGALRLLVPAYAGSVKCVYIDPPYNTGSDGFVYKDGYQRSTWGAMICDRLAAALPMVTKDAGFFCSIDENEQANLRQQMNAVLGESNFVADMVWAAGRKNDSKLVSVSHEYIVSYAIDREYLKTMGVEWRQRKKGLDDIYAQYDRLKKEHEDDYEAMTAGLKQWFRDLPDSHPAKAHKHYSVVDKRGIYFPDNISWPGGGGPKYEVKHPVTGKPVKVPAAGWRFSNPDEMQRRIDEELIHFGPDEKSVPCRKSYLVEHEEQVPYSVFYQDGRAATKRLRHVMGNDDFGYPKDETVISEVIEMVASDGECVIDYFAGSGTTGQSVLDLQRAGKGRRPFALVEMGSHYDNALRPRTAKIIYSPDWKEGKAQAHDQGLSALVKCFAVESYEDALNNLPAPTGGMFDGRPAEEADALIRYALDLEMGPHLLDLDIFRDPWGHAINAQLAGDDEIKRHRVDLVETFNYLLGLRVSAYGPIERYSAEFERAEHDEDTGKPDDQKSMGRVKLKGRLRRDPEGAFKFQRVEGILNDGNDTRVLVVWRTLTDDPEQDAAVLDAWMARHREATTERTEHRDYHQIYINGPVTLPQPTAEIRTVYPIEEAFKRKMFEDTDGVS